MTADNHGTEQIVKAVQAADSLVSALKEAHAGLDAREESLLMELLSDAQTIRDRLNRLARAKGVATELRENEAK